MIKDPLLWVMAAAIFVLLILYIRAINQLDRQDRERRSWKIIAQKWADKMMYTAYQLRKDELTSSENIIRGQQAYQRDFNKKYEA